MSKVTDGGRMAQVVLDEDDLSALEDDEAVSVNCPITDGTIALSPPAAATIECECCGQSVEPDATPSVGAGTVSDLRKGGTSIFTTAHDDDDVTIVVRADWKIADGWV